MPSTSTLSTLVRIDVSPDGVRLSIDSLDADLADLIALAGSFSVETPLYHTVDTKDVVIKSTKVLQFVTPTVITP